MEPDGVASNRNNVAGGLLDQMKRRFGQATEKEQSDIDLVNRFKSAYKYCYEARRRKEYEWFINDNFYNNNMYLRYNIAARRIQSLPSDKITDKVIINKIWQILRGVVSFLNREHPTVNVLPGTQSDESYQRAKKEEHLCMYWYEHLQMNMKTKQITLDASKYGPGWAKIIWDRDALSPTNPYRTEAGMKNHVYGEVQFERVDPFDIYCDPLARDKSEMRYIFHALPRPVGEIKNNKNYNENRKLVVSDNKNAASWLRQMQINQDFSGVRMFQTTGTPDLDTLIVIEGYMREFKEDGTPYVRAVTITETGILLRDEEWWCDEFPFEYDTSDVANGPLNANGVIKNIREINRALNQQYSQVLESSRIMGRINWLTPRGAKVNVITDETGNFIEYDANPAGKPEQTQPVNLPPYIQENMMNLERLMEDVAGTHDAFYGKAPSSRASGDLVNALQSGDSNSLSIMRDNLDDFMVRCFKLMLKTAKYHYQQQGISRTFRLPQMDSLGQYDFVTIKPGDISTEDDIQVRTGTNTPYNLDEKRNFYLELWKEKAITDPNVLFRLLDMPDMMNVIQDSQLDVERALDENKYAVKTKDLKQMDDPVISEDHAAHLKVHDQLIKSPAWKKLTPQQKTVILDHRSKHIQFSIQLAKIQASMNVDPIKRSETLMVRTQSLTDLTPIERGQFIDKFGMQSDAALIQQRGGLFIQNPEDAINQAKMEDLEMMDGKPVPISLGDNHQAHLMTHAELLQRIDPVTGKPMLDAAPDHIQKFIKDHFKAHEMAFEAQQQGNGLQVTPGFENPPEPSLKPPAPAIPQQPFANVPAPKPQLDQTGQPVKPATKIPVKTQGKSQSKKTIPIKKSGQPPKA